MMVSTRRYSSRWRGTRGTVNKMAVKLGDICNKIGSGFTPTGGSNVYVDSGVALVRSQNVLNMAFSTDGLAFINESIASAMDNVSLCENDILLNITGDSVARMCLVPKEILPARVNQHVCIIRVDDKKANPQFVYYQLYGLQKNLLSLASVGATRKALTKQMIEDLEIELPVRQLQDNIVAIMSNIQSKIDVNKTINDNLLVQLWSLYEHLIVKKSNDSIKIGDVAKIYSGGTPNTSNPDYWGGDYGWLSSGETRNRFILDTEKTITEAGIANSSTRLANELDTVIALAGQGLTRGQTSILFTKTYVNQSVIVVNSVEQYAYLVFCNLSRRYDELRTLSDSMSIRGSITTKMIADLEMPIVGTDQLDMFNNNAKDILSKIKVNISEIRVLKDLRDYILPKLMSGEIDVSTLEIPN